MKIIKVQIELGIDDDLSADKDSISNYLNNKLYTDPEFFGDFGPENIVEVKEWEWDDLGSNIERVYFMIENIVLGCYILFIVSMGAIIYPISIGYLDSMFFNKK